MSGSSSAAALSGGAAAAAGAAAVCGVLRYAAGRAAGAYAASRPFDSIEFAVAQFRRGVPLVVMDDEDRENEGDIIAPAAGITADTVALIVNHTTGIICAPMPAAHADRLALAPMLARNEDPKGTAFTVTCDAKGGGITTGVSAHDRMVTLRTLADGATVPGDLSRPGHIFPLRAKCGGVLARRGHTEATVDLCQLAGFAPAVGVIGELVLPSGDMMRSDDCKRFAWKHGMPCITIDALATYIAGRPEYALHATPWDSIEFAVEQFRQGVPLVVMDDEDRENEGDIIAPAAGITADTVALMVNHTTGIICAPMPEAHADRLALAPMLSQNEDPKGTAFTVTCDAKGGGITTGVSAHDRMVTLRTLADRATAPQDLSRPGHIFPLRAKEGGVLTRRGHTEATVDLCRLAGFAPAVGVIGELVLPSGDMMRSDDCKIFAREHGMPCITIDALAEHLRAQQRVHRPYGCPTPPAGGPTPGLTDSDVERDEGADTAAASSSGGSVAAEIA